MPLLGELCQPFKKNLMKTGVGGLINHRSLQGPRVSGWPGGLASSTDVALKGEAALSWAAGPSASSGSTSTSTRPAGCVSSGGELGQRLCLGSGRIPSPAGCSLPAGSLQRCPLQPQGHKPVEQRTSTGLQMAHQPPAFWPSGTAEGEGSRAGSGVPVVAGRGRGALTACDRLWHSGAETSYGLRGRSSPCPTSSRLLATWWGSGPATGSGPKRSVLGGFPGGHPPSPCLGLHTMSRNSCPVEQRTLHRLARTQRGPGRSLSLHAVVPKQ